LNELADEERMWVSASEEGEASKRVIPYDFSQPMTLAREHMRILETGFETFSRHWGTQLVASLRTTARVHFDSVELVTYDDYVASLPPTTAMLVLSVEGGRRSGVLQIPLETVLDWIDRMLGGRGSYGKVPNRDLTEIEQELLRQLMVRVLNDLDYSFSSIMPLDTALKTIQYTPQAVQVVAASTPVLVSTFTQEVEGAPAMPSTLMLPAEGIVEALRNSMEREETSADDRKLIEQQRVELDRAVQEVPVDVTVRLRQVGITPREVVGLNVGDTLPLHQSAAEPLEVVVGDMVLAHAAVGTSGSRLAGLIVDTKRNTDDN
jgi:flagellar motor switch protein FliM